MIRVMILALLLIQLGIAMPLIISSVRTCSFREGGRVLSQAQQP